MLKYGSLELCDLDEINNLYERYLNSGKCIKGWLREGLQTPGYCGVKCTDGDKIVGAFSARPAIEFTCGHEELVRRISEQWSGHRIYTVDMLAVLPEYRGQGVARELAKRLREKMLQNGCQEFVVEAWRRSKENDTPMSGVLKYFGRQMVVGVYDDFYKDIRKYGIVCPECGEICRCGAEVTVVELENGGGL